jgi:hypothetical protein
MRRKIKMSNQVITPGGSNLSLRSLVFENIFEPGEEVLNVKTSFKNKPGRKESIIAGIDAGSTQIRGLLWDKEDILKQDLDALNDVTTIPSVYVPISALPETDSDVLFETMISSITSLDVGNTFFSPLRLVRGRLTQLVEGKEKRVGSSEQKTNDPTFYYNLIDWIGYSAMLKYKEEVPEELVISLGVALPPDEQTTFSLNKFNYNLKEFVWTYLPLNISIKIKFRETQVMTEPEAFIKGYFIISGEPIPETILHLDGGGRSIGGEIMVGGISQEKTQKTLDFGGTQLLEAIDNSYRDQFGGMPNSRSTLEEAVRTGVLKLGKKTSQDITDLIKREKDIKGEEIFSDMKTKIFDSQTKVKAATLAAVTVSGRLFDKGEYDYSITEKLFPLFESYFVNAEIKCIEGSYIPQGLLLGSFEKFQMVQEIFEELPISDEVEEEQSTLMPETEVAATSEESEEITGEYPDKDPGMDPIH